MEGCSLNDPFDCLIVGQFQRAPSGGVKKPAINFAVQKQVQARLVFNQKKTPIEFSVDIRGAVVSDSSGKISLSQSQQ